LRLEIATCIHKTGPGQRSKAAWPLRILCASRSVDASYKERSSWRRAKLIIRCLKLSPGTPEYVEAQQKSTLCRVLLDLKRSSEWKARCVLQARRQQRGTHRRSLSTHRTDTAPMHCAHAAAKYSQAFSEYSPHRCSPSTHRRTRSTHRTDALYPNQRPLSPGSSCTRCCVTRPLLCGLRGCCACRAHVRNDQSSVPKYETRNERVHPDRNPSPLRRDAWLQPKWLSRSLHDVRSTLRLQIYICEDMNYRSRSGA
jgi:hypothetical protein